MPLQIAPRKILIKYRSTMGTVWEVVDDIRFCLERLWASYGVAVLYWDRVRNPHLLVVVLHSHVRL